jgi:nitric oxide reductase NorQ protein
MAAAGISTIDQVAPKEEAAPAETAHIKIPEFLQPPKLSPYLITMANKGFLIAADNISNKGGNINVLVNGPHGSGKSELAQQYAASRHRPYAQLDCGGLSEAYQIFGKMTLKNGQTVYEKGLFTEAIRTPGCVIHLQELNRAESDRALNALFSLLDDTCRSLWVEELGELIEVAPGVTFFATMNEGFQYIGTMPLDAALKDRFLIKIDLKPLPIEWEARLLELKFGTAIASSQITDITTLVGRIRSEGGADSYISTRDLIGIGHLVIAGLTPVMAMFATMGTSMENLEAILLSEHLRGLETSTSILDESIGVL